MIRALNADFSADVRYALRGFKRTPGLTVITVLTLAVGLGATAAIFSVVNAVLLKPLPYAEPERLVQIVEHVPASEGFGGTAQRRTALNTAELDWWRQNSKALSEIAVTAGGDGRTLATVDGSVQLYGQRVSPALFAIRGVPPLLGRGLLPDDERPDNDVVVLGEAAWRDYFNATPDVVGSRIQLNNQTLTVVGVMPPVFGEEAFWTPFVPPRPGSPGVQFVGAQARLAAGVSLESASAEINTLGLQLRGIEPEPGAEARFEVVRTLDELTAAVTRAAGARRRRRRLARAGLHERRELASRSRHAPAAGDRDSPLAGGHARPDRASGAHGEPRARGLRGGRRGRVCVRRN